MIACRGKEQKASQREWHLIWMMRETYNSGRKERRRGKGKRKQSREEKRNTEHLTR